LILIILTIALMIFFNALYVAAEFATVSARRTRIAEMADSGNRWTVPLGGGVGKLLKIGNQAINVRTEAYYNVEKPDLAPDWHWGFTIQFLFPK